MIGPGSHVTHRADPTWTGRVLRVEKYPGVALPQATVIWSWAVSARAGPTPPTWW